jgi:hypothetical protein
VSLVGDCSMDLLLTAGQIEARVAPVRAAINAFANHASSAAAAKMPTSSSNCNTGVAGTVTAQILASDGLLSYLGTPIVASELEIPFPDFTDIPFWFVPVDTYTVMYRPRQKVIEFKEYMDPLINLGGSVNVLGFIGAGKSHILLAYAVYMMGRRALEIPTPPIIYLSNGTAASESIVHYMKMAIALAYFDDIGEIANIVNLQDAENFFDLNKRSTGEIPILIFDDWNIFLDTTNDRKIEAKDHLMTFAGCLKVFGISFNNSEHMRKLYWSAHRFILNGLTEAEWSIWKSSPSLANLAASIDNKEKEDRVAHMTGLLPLLLTDLTGFVKKYNDLDVAIEQLVNVSDSPKSLSGSWVSDKLKEFYSKFDESRKDEHVALMAAALGRFPCYTICAGMYDHRFFYRDTIDDLEPCLVPSCGVVEVQLALLLQSLERDRFLRAFNAAWIGRTMRANISNSSVRGFAFELYARAQLMVNLFHHLDSHIPQQYCGKKFPKSKWFNSKATFRNLRSLMIQAAHVTCPRSGTCVTLIVRCDGYSRRDLLLTQMIRRPVATPMLLSRRYVRRHQEPRANPTAVK